ncbi:MAG: YbgC/FadM family acyl-CoA thioesterase [Porticoccaceae bacterium]|nr:MAG: YbgC/FadM family acyl-CoA thioesterase [Porticoccaceae bacterium]
MSTIFELPVRVYIEDTDAQGIVYYVNYLKYMERARSEWLRDHGFANPAFWGDDSIFVVHSLNVRYHRPARLYDDLIVTALAVAHGRAWFEVEQTVRRGEELLCAGLVKVACADRHTMKPVRMPGEMLARIFANA